MYEMRDLARPQEPESEPRSSIVSFPDHYLVPYIKRCKKSKPITCGCSLLFLGLAVFCFFATNYMLDYPVTESRKIAFVFLGIIALLAMFSCLKLRFIPLYECRCECGDTVQYEATGQNDVEFSDSFSANFVVWESSILPQEVPSQNETPGDSSSVAHNSDDPHAAVDISTFRYTGNGHPPRHSISNRLSPDTPLLVQSRPLEFAWPSWMKRGNWSQNSGAVTSKNKYPSNYSTFENGTGASETAPLLVASTFENGTGVSETAPLLVASTIENGSDAPETEPLHIENGSGATATEPLHVENGSSASAPLQVQSMCEIGSDALETELRLVDSSVENGSDASETKRLLPKKH